MRIRAQYIHDALGFRLPVKLRTGKAFCALVTLFCYIVRESAIFAACTRCANDGFAWICKEIVSYVTREEKQQFRTSAKFTARTKREQISHMSKSLFLAVSYIQFFITFLLKIQLYDAL